MPIFNIDHQKLTTVEQINFATEKELQNLIEKNLETVFNCQFIASEFSTGAYHAGRIDTLAISEDNNPVIIEYKKVESSELINQSLFYLYWIQDHKGDFEIAVQNKLGKSISIDWSDIRVICIAPNYKKYDLHAAQVMGANIELWKYHLYSNKTFSLERILNTNKTSTFLTNTTQKLKNPIMVEAGKKAAIARQLNTYTFDERLDGKNQHIVDLAENIREFILSLDESIEEIPKKYYVAYKISQNIVCMEIQSKLIKLFLKLSPNDIIEKIPFYRDVSQIGHYGTGNIEMTLSNQKDFDYIKKYIELAYNKIGG